MNAPNDSRSTTFTYAPSGRARPFAFLLGISLIVGGVLLGLLSLNSGSLARMATEAKSQPLLMYCGASMKPAAEAVAKQYQQEYGIAVQIQYDASENLLNAIKLTHKGDIFLPAEQAYITQARQDDLVREVLPIAQAFPVIAVKKGNPKNIHAIDDLKRDDVSVAFASPAAAIGRLSVDLLQKSGDWEALKRRRDSGSKVSELGKEPEVGNAVKIGAVDAGVIWDSSVHRYPELEMVRVPQFEAAPQSVVASVLSCSAQPTRALHFARYLTARNKGLLHFKDAGYTVVDGDEWDDHPQLTLFAGAMLRPAIADTLKDFQAREGIPTIQTVYNGCGILVGQMRTAARPDAYFACDKSFMKQVANLFGKPQTISANEMVILVRKGNPRKISELRDLMQPGLKLGIGDEQQCALGFLTKQVLDRTQICEAVMKNVSVRSPTGDFLVNQMRSGSLDAVIVYKSNATFVKDALDVVPVNLPQQFATQPVAVGKTSKHRQLAERLMDALSSPASRKRFEENGFRWLAQPN